MKVKKTLALKEARHDFSYPHKAPLGQSSSSPPGGKVISRAVRVDNTLI